MPSLDVPVPQMVEPAGGRPQAVRFPGSRAGHRRAQDLPRGLLDANLSLFAA